MVVATHYAGYRAAMLATLAAYRARHFAERDVLFEKIAHDEIAFAPEAAHRNFFDPALYHELTHRPPALRRLHSSRALAISVFGTLARREDLALLAEVPCEDGRPVLASAAAADGLALQLQHILPGQQVVDVWLHGKGTPLAVAGRLLEREPGALPLPTLGQGDQSFRTLVVYDARNPAWAAGRSLSRRLDALADTLRPPAALRRTTWQAIAAALARSPWFTDLLGYLREKYGIEG